MTTVAIVGGDGVLVGRVEEILRQRPDVDTVRRVPSDTPDDLAGVDTLVVMDPSLDRDDVGRILDAAAAAEVGALVYLSTATVYGAHSGNDLPLAEESRPRPNDGHADAQRHHRVEQALAAWERPGQDTAVAVLRPAMLVGGDTPPWLVDAFVGGRVLAVRGHRPPFQFVHLDDLTTAIAHVAVQRLDGIYNVAAEGWLSGDEVDAVLRRRAMEVPEEVVVSSAERLRLAGISRMQPGLVHHLMHPCVVSVDRLVATGWQPVHTNRDAVAQLADSHGDRVVIGPVTTTRHEVRQAAGIAAGVAGGLLALGVLARRRRRRGDDAAMGDQ